jgi:transposase-like protein
VFSAADKLRIVQEAERCLASGERGALGALLRREGIYSSLLTSWRTHLGAHGSAGLAAKKPGRKPKFTEAERLNVELTKRNAVLEKKLRIANALIALQKNHRGLRPTCWTRSSTSGTRGGGLGRSGRELFGDSEPVKKHGPENAAHLAVVTRSRDPV